MNSKIEWTDATWNPSTGCDKVSPGCGMERWPGDDVGGCYAMAMAKRLKAMGQDKYQRDGDPRTSGPGFGITMHPAALDLPLRWRKPRKVFVNSMSDLFHDGVSDEFIWSVWVTMARTPQHTFQILTKRHGRMRSLLNRWAADGWEARDHELRWNDLSGHVVNGALPNVWLGVSTEDQKRADIRIPALLQTPAAVRWISAEPLLGPIDLAGPVDRHGGRPRLTYWLTGRPGWGEEEQQPGGLTTQPLEIGPRLDWVVAGGESGPNSRPMHPDWPIQLRDQCFRAGVPFLFKQWGEYGLLPRGWNEGTHDRNDHGITVANDGTVYQPGDLSWPDGPRRGEAARNDHGRAHLHAMYRVGKHESGRELAGETWDQYPAATS